MYYSRLCRMICSSAECSLADCIVWYRLHWWRLHSLVGGYQPPSPPSDGKMKAAYSSETMLMSYRTTWSHIPVVYNHNTTLPHCVTTVYPETYNAHVSCTTNNHLFPLQQVLIFYKAIFRKTYLETTDMKHQHLHT